MCTDRGYISMDIETDSLLPPLFDDVHDAPPAIFCAATMELVRAASGGYHAQPARPWPLAVDVSHAPMSAEGVRALVDYMWTAWTERGLRVLAWNGAGFDLRVLAAHVRQWPETHRRVVDLTWSCCDPMFAFFMAKGFPVGLNAVAKAGRSGICKSGCGADVAEMWAQGHLQRLGVLAYCCRDVEVTAIVMSEIEATGQVRWISKSGKPSIHRAVNGAHGALASVRAANAVALPDTSWMREPIAKEEFVGWITGHVI